MPRTKENKPRRLSPLCKIGETLAVLLFWLAIWQALALLLARRYGVNFILPTVTETAAVFARLLPTAAFYKTVFFSILRIAAGFALGVGIAISLALLTHISGVARAIFSPVMTVIRATPVASFIMVLWVLIRGNENAVPAAIALLMVLPIVWQSMTDGFAAIHPDLDEVLRVFGASPLKKFRLLTLPTLADYLIPALVTAVGLSWKAGIAAEIIAYTRHSIGSAIKDAKDMLEAAEMFAWTITVVLISLLFEKAIARAAAAYARRGATAPTQSSAKRSKRGGGGE